MFRRRPRLRPGWRRSVIAGATESRPASIVFEDLVFPAWVPRFLSDEYLFGPLSLGQTLERPAGREMADDQDLPSVPARSQLTQTSLNSGQGLGPTLPLRIWNVQVSAAVPVHNVDRLPAQSSVVALAKPPIAEDRDAGAGKRKLDGLRRSPEVRAEDRREISENATPTQLACLLDSVSREADIPPSACEPALVVQAGGVRLEHCLYGHTSKRRTKHPPSPGRRGLVGLRGTPVGGASSFGTIGVGAGDEALTIPA